MPTGIDFSTMVCETLTFTSRKLKTYDLRDDVPMELLVAGTVGMTHVMQLSDINPKTSTAEEAQSRYDDAVRQLRAAFGEIIRYSVPSATDDELRVQFPIEDMVRIIDFFMNRLGMRYAPPQPSTSEQVTPIAAAIAEDSTSTSS